MTSGEIELANTGSLRMGVKYLAGTVVEFAASAAGAPQEGSGRNGHTGEKVVTKGRLGVITLSC